MIITFPESPLLGAKAHILAIGRRGALALLAYVILSSPFIGKAQCQDPLSFIDMGDSQLTESSRIASFVGNDADEDGFHESFSMDIEVELRNRSLGFN